MLHRFLLSLFAAILIAVPASSAQNDSVKTSGIRLEKRAKDMPGAMMGPFVILPGDRLLTIKDELAYVSGDDGKSWKSWPLLPNGPTVKVSNERALLRTKNGAIILVFMNLASERKWKWDKEKNAPAPDSRLDVWSMRSLDDGKTWIDAQAIMKGYCGAIRDMIQTRSGEVVATVQPLLIKEARHATQPYISSDDGKTWTAGQLLDIGGRGHHDGSVEATLTELKDGRLWMLLRSNMDDFLSTTSSDSGLTWIKMKPAGIGASSSPAMLKRLTSGRLLLVWNQLYPEGKSSYERRSGNYSQHAGSWHREELSIAFSSDDGKTWTLPVVIARKAKTWISYPYVLERRPGEIWITTMQGGLRVIIHEQDFVSKNSKKAR